MINSEQIKEWVDSPVTEALYWLYSRDLANEQEIRPINCLIGGQPQLTQENLIEHITKEFELEGFLGVLKGKWKVRLSDLSNYDSLVKDDEDEDSEKGE